MSRWADEASARAESDAAIGSGHAVVLSGEVAWCTECGNYADAKAVGLSRPCRGPPDRLKQGGMAGQLKKLLRGYHPRTGAQMPPAIDSSGHAWTPGPSKNMQVGVYANLAHYRTLKREADEAEAYAASAWGSLQAALEAALPVPDAPQSGSSSGSGIPHQLNEVHADASPPRSARQKMVERLLRVRAKEAQAKAQARATDGPRTGSLVRRRCSTKQAAGW